MANARHNFAYLIISENLYNSSKQDSTWIIFRTAFGEALKKPITEQAYHYDVYQRLHKVGKCFSTTFQSCRPSCVPDLVTAKLCG